MWMQDTGPAGACIGLTSKLLGVVPINVPRGVKITYGGGDVVDTTPRQVDVYIYCDIHSTVLSFQNLIVPYPQDPPPPYYLYSLFLNSSTLCSTNGTSECPALPGFDFNRIASFNNYQTSWTVDGTTQSIDYAPCTGGISAPCGTNSWNQCANKHDCCAVCQNWVGSSGPDASCLGLTSKLLGVKILDPVTVVISYGGGDMVENIPRQVDIYISCDPAADILTFVKFIQPTAQTPPPPVYLYQLFLSSNSLCFGKPISEFLATLGIQLP
jgi:hypothetical protein